jgi:hypothetical protein
MGIVRCQYLTGGNDFGFIIHRLFRFLCFMNVYQGITPDMTVAKARATHLAQQLLVKGELVNSGEGAL